MTCGTIIYPHSTNQIHCFLAFPFPLPSSLLLKWRTTSAIARPSSNDVTSHFCNHFLIIPTHHACKMCAKCPGTKSALWGKIEDLSSSAVVVYTVLTQVISGVERTRTAVKFIKMESAIAKCAGLLVLSLNMGIYDFRCHRCHGCRSSPIIWRSKPLQIKNFARKVWDDEHICLQFCCCWCFWL